MIDWSETLSEEEIKDRVRKIKELISGKTIKDPKPLIDLKEPDPVVSCQDLENWKGII